VTFGRPAVAGDRDAFGQRKADEESITQELKDVADWAYAYMQAIGMVNDHTVDCYRYRQITRESTNEK
jgi:hypothetical protein